MEIIVGLQVRKFLGSEDFSKFGICVSRFCGIVGSLPKILGMKIRACENQCRIVGSEAFFAEM